MDIYLALVHHPVLNRAGDVVATAVTNLDIHDLARIARTYGCRGTFVVTPITEQQELVRRIVAHWIEGEGRTSNPDRSHAFLGLEVVASVETALEKLAASSGKPPLVIGTSAKNERATVAFEILRERLARDEEAGAALILFGTGWGLSADLLDRADVMLPPIEALPARAGYNHLPVRAAIAIVLDRLAGAR
ncbi:MAG: RNA methyltransferase [Myxococcota bacterium]